MRKQIKVEVNTSRNEITNGFNITYRGRDPKSTQVVAAELASKYIDEQTKGTVNAGTSAKQFIEEQVRMAKEELDAIDTQDGTAVLLGAPESDSHLVAQLSGWTLHFVQTSPTGRLTVTSVFARESRDGKLKGTHSRSSYIPAGTQGNVAEPEAQQYYGECEAAY